MTPKSYQDQIDTWIRARVDNGIRNWQELLAALPGIYPEAVRHSLLTQGLSGFIEFTPSARRPDLPFAYKLWVSGRLPTPHPLDACWWFGDSSLSILFDRVTLARTEIPRTILLGTPTLFHALMREGSQDVILIDSDPQVLSHCEIELQASIILSDLMRDETSCMRGEIIVADPPWYESEMRAFIWAARSVCNSGGTILVSVPPVGTRPGVSEEWERTVYWAKELGLELIEYQCGLLSYLSPPFEQNALEAAGVENPGDGWRRGDLAVFSCMGAITQPRPFSQSQQTWEECCIRGVRFRVRAPESVEWADPRLHSLEPGEILTSVSRRDPRRDLVDVWTSGNRVFRCSGRSVLLQLLRALATNSDVESRVKNIINHAHLRESMMLVQETVTKLTEIIDIECAENSAIREEYADLGLLAS